MSPLLGQNEVCRAEVRGILWKGLFSVIFMAPLPLWASLDHHTEHTEWLLEHPHHFNTEPQKLAGCPQEGIGGFWQWGAGTPHWSLCSHASGQLAPNAHKVTQGAWVGVTQLIPTLLPSTSSVLFRGGKWRIHVKPLILSCSQTL